MTTKHTSNRAACAYCGAHARPNAMYCMECGQIIIAAPAPTAAHTSMQAAALAAAQAAQAAALLVPQQPVIASAAVQRPAMEQYLLPAPNVPAATHTPRPAASHAPPLVAPPPLPKLASLDAQVIELVFADGERTKIVGTTILGRRPEATARNAGAQALAVEDDTKSVSRAHAIIEMQGQSATIADAGSANGSSVERDGSVLPLKSDRQISLRSGDRIWLGSVPIDVVITHTVRRAHA